MLLWKPSEESVSRKEWSFERNAAERSGKRWVDNWTLQSRAMNKWRKPDWQGFNSGRRGSRDRKYRQFFQGVLPQKKAKMWNSGLAQNVETREVIVFHMMREFTAYLSADDNDPIETQKN